MVLAIVLMSEETARSWGLVTDDRPLQAVVWMELAQVPTAAEADQIKGQRMLRRVGSPTCQ